jgi:hypothetical protein
MMVDSSSGDGYCAIRSGETGANGIVRVLTTSGPSASSAFIDLPFNAAHRPEKCSEPTVTAEECADPDFD